MRYFLLIIAATFLMTACSRKEYRYAEGIAWNTGYHITYESVEDLSDSIIAVLNEIDASLSPFNEQSTVSKINDNRDLTTDTHFTAVFKESQRINKLSGNAFDPTLAPLIRAWGFGQGHEVSADTLRIDSLMQFVGIDKTQLKDNSLLKENPEIEFNFSALAKGYGVDCIAEMLCRNEVTNFLVEVGGEIRASGHNPSGAKWGIGIDVPQEGASSGETAENIFVEKVAVATSGNYRNFQESGSIKFGHTISATTGRPVQTDVVSATVVSTSCMEADALATCCMALGSEKALELCNSLQAGLLLILQDGTISSNVYLKQLLKK